MNRLAINPRARAGQFIHDRHWYGDQKAKGGRSIRQQLSLGCFPLCRLAVDSQEHWVRECGHPALSPIRDKTYLDIAGALDTLALELRWLGTLVSTMTQAQGGSCISVGT